MIKLINAQTGEIGKQSCALLDRAGVKEKQMSDEGIGWMAPKQVRYIVNDVLDKPAVLIMRMKVDILRLEGWTEAVFFVVRRFGVAAVRCGWNGTGCPRKGRRDRR